MKSDEWESIAIILEPDNRKHYSSFGWNNYKLMKTIETHEYYLSPDYSPIYHSISQMEQDSFLRVNNIIINENQPNVDYYVLGKNVKSESFQKFFKTVKGIGTVHDLGHYFVVGNNNIVEAHWSNLPLDANTIEESDLFECLQDPRKYKQIHHMILYVPNSSVNSFLLNQMSSHHYFNKKK